MSSTENARRFSIKEVSIGWVMRSGSGFVPEEEEPSPCGGQECKHVAGIQEFRTATALVPRL